MREFFLFLVYYVLAVLAVYRLAYMLTADTGPARIFEHIRYWVANRYGTSSWQYEGATCFFCQSVWYATPAAIFAILLFPFLRDTWWAAIGWWVILWLAIAGLAQVLHWRVLVWMVKVNQ